MLLLKYLLMIAGFALFGSAAALVAYDVYLAAQLRHLLAGEGSGRVAGEAVAAPAAQAEACAPLLCARRPARNPALLRRRHGIRRPKTLRVAGERAA
ncbi:MAG: hypothetical protein LAN84_17675 [Acidobacteriia bacterium]|nr:hypothetical protein [Terriglobia bacterium]